MNWMQFVTGNEITAVWLDETRNLQW